MKRGDTFKREFFPKKDPFPNRPELFPKKAEKAAAPKPAKAKPPEGSVVAVGPGLPCEHFLVVEAHGLRYSVHVSFGLRLCRYRS